MRIFKKNWFSSNTAANMAYFVIYYWIVRAYIERVLISIFRSVTLGLK